MKYIKSFEDSHGNVIKVDSIGLMFKFDNRRTRKCLVADSDNCSEESMTEEECYLNYVYGCSKNKIYLPSAMNVNSLGYVTPRKSRDSVRIMENCDILDISYKEKCRINGVDTLIIRHYAYSSYNHIQKVSENLFWYKDEYLTGAECVCRIVKGIDLSKYKYFEFLDDGIFLEAKTGFSRFYTKYQMMRR